MCVPSLLQLCITAAAQALPLAVAPTPGSLPDEALCMQLLAAYKRVDAARRVAGPQFHYSPQRHLAALRQLSALWQPHVLVVTAPCCPPSQPHVALCAELQAFAASLVHLELGSLPTASWLSPGLSGLNNLSCLSLRNAPHLTTACIQQALQQLPQLKSLDLCGLAAVSDALAPTLCALTNLVVLQLNRTSCSDTTIEYLTYGNRLHQWSSTAGQQGQHRAAGTAAAAPSGCGTADMQQQWPRCHIRCWHLAYTRMTPRVAELLGSCPEILLIDLRGSGVRAAQLSSLRSRYALSSVQGAVLSRTAAMVLAAVTHEQFVCAGAAEHGADVSAIKVARAAPSSEAVVCAPAAVNEGVEALLQAAAEAAGDAF